MLYKVYKDEGVEKREAAPFLYEVIKKGRE